MNKTLRYIYIGVCIIILYCGTIPMAYGRTIKRCTHLSEWKGVYVGDTYYVSVNNKVQLDDPRSGSMQLTITNEGVKIDHNDVFITITCPYTRMYLRVPEVGSSEKTLTYVIFYTLSGVNALMYEIIVQKAQPTIIVTVTGIEEGKTTNPLCYVLNKVK